MQRSAMMCSEMKWNAIKKCISWKDLKGIDVVLCLIKWIQTRNGLQSKFIDMLSWFLFCFSLPAWRRALRWRGSAQRCLPENEGTNVYFSIAWHCIVFYNFNGCRGRNVFATVRTRGPSNIWNCLWSTWTTLHCNGGNMHNGVLRNLPCMTTTNIVDLALPVITRLILVSKVSIWEHVWISRSNHVIRLQLPWRRSTPECPNPSADGRCRWGACAQARCCSIPWPSSSHHLIFLTLNWIMDQIK